MSYAGLSMKDVDALRNKLREVGGEFHVVKNTLAKLAFEQAGMQFPEKYFDESSAVAFAFEDPQTFVKALSDFTKASEFAKVKGGFLDKKPISPEGVKALADMPRCRLCAPNCWCAACTRQQAGAYFAEPARGLAAVIKATRSPEAAVPAAG